MDPALRLHPDQEALTPAQEAEVRRFATLRRRAQVSTESVDEPEAEALLTHAYEAAQLPPPEHIHWLDGPLQLIAVLAPHSFGYMRSASMGASIRASVVTRVSASFRASAEESVRDRVEFGGWERLQASIRTSLWVSLWQSIRASMQANVGDSVEQSLQESIGAHPQARIPPIVSTSLLDSHRAYDEAATLAFYRFLDEYLAPNELHALAHFNELVSGYWLGKKDALLVRRPYLLACDAQGRLHSATGKGMEYHDGWGCYAWHGVRVPERIILTPEALTREDFLNEQDVEVRRVIQERMGSRLVLELGGVVLDTGPRGTLYEVRLPADDPEQVARYVQVQDASTERQYFLRVSPTMQTAAEAVAWTFQVAVEAYHPTHET